MKNLLLALILNQNICEDKNPEEEFMCLINQAPNADGSRILNPWICEIHPTNVTCCKQIEGKNICCDAEVIFGQWVSLGCFEVDKFVM